MRSVTPMRAAKTGYIIMSVLLCVLGVVLFVWPGVSVTVIGELLGIGMIVFGAVKVAGYLSRDLFRLAFQYDLAFGVLLMALGIVTLTHPGETIGFLCVVYGILVLSDGLFKVQIAVDAKRFGIDRWWAILLAAACAGVLGVLLVLRPGEGADHAPGCVAVSGRRDESAGGSADGEDHPPPAAGCHRDRRI